MLHSKLASLFGEAPETDDGYRGFEDLDQEDPDYDDAYSNVRDESGDVTVDMPESLILIDPT